MKNSTINYYNLNAQKYFDSTFDKQAITLLKDFCSDLPKNSTILDVGCGSGRDSLYFIEQGFKVIAIDASADLAQLASQKIGQKVIVTKVQDLNIQHKVDAVWAMASLLHLPKNELPIAIHKCLTALKPNQPGKFMCSLKLGEGQSYDENGRFFSYYKPEEIKDILTTTGWFEHLTITVTGDNLGRDTQWINAIGTVNIQLQNILKKSKKP